jgi:hypothetical protein
MAQVQLEQQPEGCKCDATQLSARGQGALITCDDLVDPLDGLDQRVALLLVHHRGSLAPQNLAVGYQTHHQLVAKGLGLQQGCSMIITGNDLWMLAWQPCV